MRLNNNLKGAMILSSASFLWGMAFVVQSALSKTVSPFLLNSIRSFIGVLFLIAVLFIRKKYRKKEVLPTNKHDTMRALLYGGVCGILLTISVNLQQFGLMYYPVGVAAEARGGFLTALYVVMVPLFAIFLGKKLRLSVILAVVVAIIGIYLLCLSDTINGIYIGDLFVLACAVSFSIHILVVDHIGSSIDGILLSTTQFLVCGILSGVLSIIFETPDLRTLPSVIPHLLYMGIGSSGIGYTLQIIGQKYAEPTIASISMSLESVFATLGGWIILGNRLSPREFAGCALVFVAIMLAQLQFSRAKKKIRKGIEN